MADQLYVRVRGRVLGPYGRDKLQALVKRGQLGRLHEVSEDGVSWVRATSFPELFVTPSAPPGMAASAVQQPAPQASGQKVEFTVEPPGDGAPKAPERHTWYYTCGSGQLGPVDFAFLQKLAAAGQLGSSDLVWTEGMSHWTSPGLIPGLGAGAVAAGAAAGSGTSTNGEITPGVCRALRASRPWILFMAISILVGAGLYGILGIWLLVFGISADLAVHIEAGLLFLASATIGIVSAVLLLSYARGIAVLQFKRDFRQLEITLDAAGRWWIFVGVLQAITLVGLVLLSMWAMAVAGGETRAMMRRLLYPSAENHAETRLETPVTARIAPSENTEPLPPATPAVLLTSLDKEDAVADAVAFVACGGRYVLPNGSTREIPITSGTAFAISPHGHLLTNKHVIEGFAEPFQKYQITATPMVWVFFGKQKYVAEILYTSTEHDAAILKVPKNGGHYFRLSSLNKIARSTPVFALGFPGAAREPLSNEEMIEKEVREQTAAKVESVFKPRDFEYVETSGTVSRVTTEETTGRSWIQHNADVNHGNSGGPLVGKDAVVLGINTLSYTVSKESGVNSGVFYSLSMPQLREPIAKLVPEVVWE